MTIIVRRKGLQEDLDEWRTETQIEVEVQPLEAHIARKIRALVLDIKILHGSGQGCISIDVKPGSFHAIAQAMMEADPVMANKAFDAAKATGKREILYDKEDMVIDWEPLLHEKAQR